MGGTILGEKKHINASHEERSKRSQHMHFIESAAFHIKAVIPVIVDFSGAKISCEIEMKISQIKFGLQLVKVVTTNVQTPIL